MTPLERRAEELRERYPNGPMPPHEPRPSVLQFRLAAIVAVVLLIIAGIQAAGPEALGIPTIAFRWLGVIAFVFSGIQPFLPAIQKWGDARG